MAVEVNWQRFFKWSPQSRSPQVNAYFTLEKKKKKEDEKKQQQKKTRTYKCQKYIFFSFWTFSDSILVDFFFSVF